MNSMLVSPQRARHGSRGAVLLVLLSVTLSLSGIMKAQEPRVIEAPIAVPKPVVKTGEANRYRLAMKIEARSPMGVKVIRIAEKYRTTVKEAESEGIWTLEYRFESAKVALGEGKDLDVLGMMPIVSVVRDKKGQFSSKIQGGTDEGNAEIAGVLQQLAAARDNFLPNKPVKVGDRWKIAFSNANLMLGSAKLEGEAELLGKEKVQGVETLKIKFTAEGDEKASGGKQHVEGILNVHPALGTIVRFSEKGDGIFAASQAHVELEVSLLGKDETEASP